jgi:putative hemolysin
MEIVILLALILLNGVFAMSEMSLVSSRRFKLENARKKGSAGAKTALDLSENPSRFLSTVQIGITLIGILLGVYSGENLTGDLKEVLSRIPAIAAYADGIATTLIVVLVTFFSIVLGELLPKRIGMAFPESIAILFARPMKWLSIITSPFVWLLMTTNDLLLRLLGIKRISESKISEEEIKSIIKESAETGEIQDIEHNIMERVFELGDRKVDSLYTHRKDIIFFTLADSWDDIKMKINQEKHSAYPVSKSQNLDDIIGIVLLKDLFKPLSEHEFKISDYIRKPIYINENTFAYKVLELFKTKRMHYGIVVDEYGATMGIVTMDDLMDALVGDSTENDQEEYKIVQRNEDSWLVDGQYSVIDFIKYFGMEPPEGFLSGYTTVAGMLIFQHSQLPEVGDRFWFEPYEIEVIDKDGQRIDKVMVTKKHDSAV